MELQVRVDVAVDEAPLAMGDISSGCRNLRLPAGKKKKMYPVLKHAVIWWPTDTGLLVIEKQTKTLA